MAFWGRGGGGGGGGGWVWGGFFFFFFFLSENFYHQPLAILAILNSSIAASGLNRSAIQKLPVLVDISSEKGDRKT